ncbi:MAG: ABC-F family ATP-binding cassette domain-containing protein [candidate division KSB1 bacterium]|nr:ABC-F family ATP-binding cassette domain-containing protein [candidate division KSB1 bacterium]
MRQLLRGIDWAIPQGSRAALVGPNGAGKTTLCRILTGEIRPDRGNILKPKDYRIGYLPQEEIDQRDQPILDCVIAGKEEALKLAERMEELRRQLQANPSEELIAQLGEIEHRFQALDGYKIETQAKAVLSGLGFKPDDFNRSLHEFSGGKRMRVYLARLLLMNPDLLLLDEPTNHLDIASLEWLEEYLSDFRGSVVVISHDRFFIDRIAQKIYELYNGRLKGYTGNYHAYERQKAFERETALKQSLLVVKERKKQQEFIDRFRYKATKARQVQSRIKALEKLQDVELETAPKSYRIRLQAAEESYHDIIHLRNVWFRYDRDWVLRNISLDLYRGQKAALVGENGVGKTTLAKLMAGFLSPQQGYVQLGRRVTVGYYAQHQTEALDLSLTVIDQVLGFCAEEQIQHVRNLLGLFGFHGDDVFKPIAVLSGGEKARVSLCRFLLSPANFLIMDEPTNHLDMASREALEEALSSYDGTLLLISHDRYFLDKIVNRVFELRDGELHQYEGNYSDYLRLRRPLPESPPPERNEKTSSPGYKSKEEKRREAEARQAVSKRRNELTTLINQFETEIMQQEARREEVERLLADPQTYKDGARVASLARELNLIKVKIDELYAQWGATQNELEELLRSLP